MYKTAWTPCIEKELYRVMESTRLMDKYAVAVQRNDGKVVGHLPQGKSGDFAKKKHSSRIIVLGKAASTGDGL